VPEFTTVYYWTSDSTVHFATRDTADALLDTGVIHTSGPIRAVRLPEGTTVPTWVEMRLITIVSDSTEIRLNDDSLINTYYWHFDSLGTDTLWQYRQPGGDVQWLQSYTNVYSEDGLLYRRSPAMEGTAASIYFYSDSTGVFTQEKRTERISVRISRMAGASACRAEFLINGRSISSSGKRSFMQVYISVYRDVTPSVEIRRNRR
jgi:hypothetical protein